MPTSYRENRQPILEIIKGLEPKSILDIGVGWGTYGMMIRKEMPSIYLDGVEVWDYDNHGFWKNYDHIYRADITDFEYPEYDLYLMVDVIEHITKEDAHKLLKKLKGKVIVSTPWNYPQENQENPYENHISQWSLEDFDGYKITDYSNELSIIILIEML